METTPNTEELFQQDAEQLVENAEFESEQDNPTESEQETEEKPAESKKEDKLSPYEKTILTEMQRRASGEDGDMPDTLLADALASKDKDIHKCMAYVVAQARKKAVGNCAMIEDAVVYGWAHHYYIEPNEVIDKELKPAPKKTEGKPTASTPAKGDKKAKNEPKKGKAGKDAPKQTKPAGNIFLQALEKERSKASKGAEQKPRNAIEQKVTKNGKEYTITQYTLFDL